MAEIDLERLIENGDFPFLYLYFDKINEEDLKNIDTFLELCHEHHSTGNESFNFFINGLAKFPAKYLLFLTFKLSKRIGSEGDQFKIHEHVDKILNLELSQNKKEKLWEAYRKALISLGLPLNSTQTKNYIVEEYKRQIGIPHNYIKPLVDKLLKYSESYGSPAIDDNESINSWKSNFLIWVYGLPKFMMSVLELDDHNIYLNSFIKLLNGDSYPKEYEFEDEMKKAIEGYGDYRNNRYTTPKILLRDGNIGILLPGGYEWELISFQSQSLSSLDGRKYSLFDDKFIIFDEIIDNIEVKNSKGNIWKFNIWDKNDLLFFSNKTGDIKKYLVSDNCIYIEPGEYICLSQNKINHEWIEENPYLSIYSNTLCMAPGDVKDINCSLQLKVQEKPYLLFKTEPYKDINGFAFYPSTNLCVCLYFPELDSAISNELLLRIIANDKQVVLKTAVSKNGLHEFSRGEDLSQFKSGLHRYRFEVLYKNKVQAWTSEYIWNGLINITEASFKVIRKPENLLSMDNAEWNEVITVLAPKNTDKAFIKLNFNIDGIIKHIIWSAKDIALSIDRYAKELGEQPISIGSRIAVAQSSRMQLIIYSNSDLELIIGTFQKIYKFSRSSRQSLSLSVLMEYATDDGSLWAKRIETGQYIKLLELSTLHTVSKLFRSVKPESLSVSYDMCTEPQRVKFKFEDLLYGGVLTSKEYIFNEGTTDIVLENGIRMIIYKSGNKVEFISCCTGWRDGWWFIDFEFMINGRWGRPTNKRQDFYPILQIVYNSTFIKNNPKDTFSEFAYTEKLSCFERINRRLMICYAQDSWDLFPWLKDVWYSLLQELTKTNEPTIIARLIQLSLESPINDDVSGSWLPLIHLGASRPKIYSLPTETYKSCKYTGLSGLEYIENTLKYFHKANNFHCLAIDGLGLTAATLFEQFEKYVSGKTHSPGILNTSIFYDTLSSCISDKLLGFDCYKFCLDELKKNYDKTSIGYDSIRGNALALCLRIKKLTSVYSDAITLPIRFKDVFHEDFTNQYIYKSEDSEEIQIYENIDMLNIFLSVYAYACRLELRHQGSLKSLLSDSAYSIKEFIDSTTFILGLGQSLFWYYLLLWEIVLNLRPESKEEHSEY